MIQKADVSHWNRWEKLRRNVTSFWLSLTVCVYIQALLWEKWEKQKTWYTVYCWWPASEAIQRSISWRLREMWKKRKPIWEENINIEEEKSGEENVINVSSGIWKLEENSKYLVMWRSWEANDREEKTLKWQWNQKMIWREMTQYLQCRNGLVDVWLCIEILWKLKRQKEEI